MARSFLSLAVQAARAAERAERTRHREQVRQAREIERAARQRERQDRLSYLEERTALVDEMNRDLAEQVHSISSILAHALVHSVNVDWNSLRRQVGESEFISIPKSDLRPKPERETFLPAQPGLFGRLLPGWKKRFDRKEAEGTSAYESALRKHNEALEEHLAALQEKRAQLELREAEVRDHNQQIALFREAYEAGDPTAVSGFFDLVFHQSEYPEGFPRHWKIAYSPESRQLVVDFDLPTLDAVVPAVERYRYTKSTDQIAEARKTQKTRQSLYTALVAQSVLRRLYEVFRSDREEIVQVAAINAFVDAIDPATGQRVRPCVLSVRTTRENFEQIDLRHVDPSACLRRLNALVSRSPSELMAIRPIIDINLADPRFIQESDVLSTLDTRPNLMELTPGEFESLITNLFQRMGLETKLTQASRDGGVDCVAFDPRPVLGGKVVVQAKRYKNTVGVSAVRDLFGTMLNEGASKGILVTTSGYGTAAYEFASGKPIELLSGSNLLYLLKEHAGIDAKIVVPDDWREPSMEAG